MPNRAESAQLNWPRWAQALLIAVLVVIAIARLYSLADNAAYHAGLLGPITTTGGTAVSDKSAPAGMARVTTVEPGGPLDKAGIKLGDSIRRDPILASIIRHRTGEVVPFEHDRGGVRIKGQITVEPARLNEAQRQNLVWQALNRLAAMVTTLIGCFILWRGWGNKTAMLLGAALIPFHVVGSSIPPTFSGPASSAVFMAILLCGYVLTYLLPAFAMRIHEEARGPLPHWLWGAAFLFVGQAWFMAAVRISTYFPGAAIPNWLTSVDFSNAQAQFAIVFSIGFLIAAWWQSAGTMRNRNAMILFALLAYTLGALSGFAGLASGSTATNMAASGALAVFNALVAGVIAPGLLAYAVLRHKLFDLGFAINRTLVYGTVSALLLATIGLLEYGAKALVPKIWMQGSVLISAGIAVGLYLVFHRIHGAVEHAVERLFFRSWQLSEAALKRFVAAAAHVEKPEALAGNYVAELVRFTGGAAASLYTRTAEGCFASAAGETIDADDPALAALRAEQGAVVPAEVSSPIKAALALPMMHQAALAGFVLLGPKPTGEDYRPDEIANLAWATQQVGLDLQAIRVRELEQNVLKLEARNANLSDILAKAAVAGT
jgi:hypothetical protein